MHQFIANEVSFLLREQADFEFPTAQYRSVFSLPSVLSGPLNYTENEVFEGAQMTGVMLRPQSNKIGVRSAGQIVTKKSILVTLNREINTSAQKLMNIETDVPVLRTIALSTVKPIRKVNK